MLFSSQTVGFIGETVGGGQGIDQEDALVRCATGGDPGEPSQFGIERPQGLEPRAVLAEKLGVIVFSGSPNGRGRVVRNEKVHSVDGEETSNP